MRYLYILISVFLFQPASIEQECQFDLTKHYIGQFDLIAIVSVTDESFLREGVNAEVVKVFKGFPGRHCMFYRSESGFQFDQVGQYLVYAAIKIVGDRTYFHAEKCSRTKSTDNAKVDLDFLSANIACIDNSLISQGACDRGPSIGVCGCDGHTYFSDCEARNQKGVVMYSVGPCP